MRFALGFALATLALPLSAGAQAGGSSDATGPRDGASIGSSESSCVCPEPGSEGTGGTGGTTINRPGTPTEEGTIDSGMDSATGQPSMPSTGGSGGGCECPSGTASGRGGSGQSGVLGSDPSDRGDGSGITNPMDGNYGSQIPEGVPPEPMPDRDER